MTNWIIAYLALNIALYFGLTREEKARLIRWISGRLLGRPQ